MTTVDDQSDIVSLVAYYRDQLAGHYGLRDLGEYVAATDVADRISAELRRRDPAVLAEMICYLLWPSASRQAQRMLQPARLVPDIDPSRCTSPDSHACAYGDGDVIGWTRHKLRTGQCAVCGGLVEVTR